MFRGFTEETKVPTLVIYSKTNTISKLSNQQKDQKNTNLK